MDFDGSLHCAYCDCTLDNEVTRDHVFPENLIPPSRRKCWKPVLVPACRSCNERCSDDEEHFRNVVNSAGDFNPPAEELFQGKIKRSFARPVGMKKISDMLRITEPVDIHGQPRMKIYPARDPRVRNVIRKIVVGLSSFHGIENALSTYRIFVDVLRFAVPGEYLARLQHEEPEPGVVETGTALSRSLESALYGFRASMVELPSSRSFQNRATEILGGTGTLTERSFCARRTPYSPRRQQFGAWGTECGTRSCIASW